MRDKKLIEDEKLRLLVLKSFIEQGQKIDEYLVNRCGYDNNEYTFMLDVKESWFSDGCEKVEIMDSVRDKNVFICTDVYNYSGTYRMREFIQHTSPNDLLQQLKDTIAACNGHSTDLSIVMPMIFAGRQHRRKGREALTCANILHEMEEIDAIRRIITCDAHDQGVEQALRRVEFENIFLTNVLLEKFISDVSIDELTDILFVAPDNGAIGRTNVYLNSFNNPNVKKYLGYCYKERDYNVVIDGKNPVIAHNYIGSDDIEGKTGCIVDDMISSGSSMFDVIDILNSKGVNNIYIFCTFALFTEGIDKFDEYYRNGKFSGVYTTNATYIEPRYKSREWLHIADCSKYIADFIWLMNKGKSITPLLHDKSGPVKVLKKKFDLYENN